MQGRTVRASTQGERLAISAILRGNLSHFTVQYGPYYRAKWLRLRSQITENGCKNQRNVKKRTAIRAFHFYLMTSRSPVFWLSLFTKSGHCEAKVSRREGPDGLAEYSL